MISALEGGDQVTAYDPSGGKSTTQIVRATFINHDTDLLDVTLHAADTGHPTEATSGAK